LTPGVTIKDQINTLLDWLLRDGQSTGRVLSSTAVRCARFLGAADWAKSRDIRMMFQGYLERGFVAETGDVEKLTKLLGHAPRRYEDFAAETAALWK
jgi:hypothetical protein